MSSVQSFPSLDVLIAVSLTPVLERFPFSLDSLTASGFSTFNCKDNSKTDRRLDLDYI